MLQHSILVARGSLRQAQGIVANALLKKPAAVLLMLLAGTATGCEDSLVPKPGSTSPTPTATASTGSLPSASASLPPTSPTVSPTGSPMANPTASVTVSPNASMPNMSFSPVPTVMIGFPNNGATTPTPTGSINPAATASSTPKPSDRSSSYGVINERRETQFTVDGSKALGMATLPGEKISFRPEAMLTVLRNTRTYLNNNATADPVITQGGLLGTQGISVMDTLRTLDFAIATLQEDIQAKRTSRLQDAKFIQQNFRVVKWRAQNPQKPQQDQIRITKYAVFTHPGSRTKTATYNTALYSLRDATGKAAAFTKQEVLAGIYEPGGKAQGAVEPIAYLTRDGLEEALMEGTILVKFTDGTQGYFNVDRSNEIPYVKDLDRKQQKRYWYFKPVNRIKGYGYTMAEKIEIEPGVTFAGDVLNIGLGKLVVIGSGSRQQMGVIADTGGAFLPNLHQLDFLAGVFANKADFERAAKNTPEYATAYFLVKK
jgi:hypothetical protein